MTTQLRLIESNEVEWKLDEHFREVGRRGLAQARAALVATAAAGRRAGPSAQADDGAEAGAAQRPSAA